MLLFSVLVMPPSSQLETAALIWLQADRSIFEQAEESQTKKGCGNKCPKFMVVWEISLAHRNWQVPGEPSNELKEGNK